MMKRYVGLFVLLCFCGILSCTKHAGERKSAVVKKTSPTSTAITPSDGSAASPDAGAEEAEGSATGSEASGGASPSAAATVPPSTPPLEDPKAPLAAVCKTPVAGQKDADPKGTITVAFSKDVDPKTVNAVTFAVVRIGSKAIETPVPGAVTYLDRAASFKPFERLDLNAGYRIKVGTGVKDADGRSLEKDLACDFATRDGRWSSAKLLEENIGNSNFPQIAGNFRNGAVAVWKQMATALDPKDLHWHVWGARFDPDPAGAWESAIRFDKEDSEDMDVPQLGVSPDGDLYWIVWQNNLSASSRIFGMRWDTSAGLAGLDPTPTLLSETVGGFSQNPRVAVDDSGHAIVAWEWAFKSPSLSFVSVNRYEEGKGGWVGRTLMRDKVGVVLMNAWPQVVYRYPVAGGTPFSFLTHMNPMVVWYRVEKDVVTPFWSRLVGTKWQAPRPVDAKAANDISPQIAASSGGAVFSVWKHHDGAGYRAMGSVMAPDSADWGPPSRLDDRPGDVFETSVAASADGGAIAVWSQRDGTFFRIFARSFDPVSGKWGDVNRLDVLEKANARHPQAAIDGAGNGYAVWESDDGTLSRIYGSRFVRAAGDAYSGLWGSAEIVDKGVTAGDEGHFPQVSADQKGIIAVWEGCGSITCNIYANQFE